MKKTLSILLALLMMAGVLAVAPMSAGATDCTHEWGDWSEVTPPTHDEPGQQVKECGECGETDTDAIPPTGEGHTWGEWETVTPSTCAAPGLEERECECGELQTRPIALKAHDFGEWSVTTPPTHVNPGLRERECKDCAYVGSEAVPALGHTWGTTWVTDATHHWKACDCGAKNAFAHTPGGWIVVTPPTATQEGSQKRQCTTCGYVVETDVIPATGLGGWLWIILGAAGVLGGLGLVGAAAVALVGAVIAGILGVAAVGGLAWYFLA